MNWMLYVPALLALLVGLVLPVQVGVNAKLATHLHSSLSAALVSFMVGTIALSSIVIVGRQEFQLTAAWQGAPAWAWLGGLLGACYVSSSIALAHHLPAAVLLGFLVSGQMIMSLTLDHYGWLGFEPSPINAQKIIGVILLIAGAILIKRG